MAAAVAAAAAADKWQGAVGAAAVTQKHSDHRARSTVQKKGPTRVRTSSSKMDFFHWVELPDSEIPVVRTPECVIV